MGQIAKGGFQLIISNISKCCTGPGFMNYICVAGCVHKNQSVNRKFELEKYIILCYIIHLKKLYTWLNYMIKILQNDLSNNKLTDVQSPFVNNFIIRKTARYEINNAYNVK